jgi:FkbM family methyltransferase
MDNIKQVGGVYLPAHETHLVDWMKKKNQVVDGKLTYQLDKRNEALKHVKQFRNAIDVGAHCGLWSMDLVKRFQLVHAFEPVALHRECFKRNVTGENHLLYPFALGETEGKISIHTTTTSSGDSWVDGDGDIPMKRLDDFDLQDIDLIKLDCEGFELFALRGGEEMLKRCKPCIVVEQKPGRAQKFGLQETEAVTYLQSLGAVLRGAKSGDYFLSWD